jgi:hypothetical protein
MLLRSSYVVMALTLLVMFGVAFTSIGNLGVLTRQRSLVMPMLLLLLCLPRRTRSRGGVVSGDDTTAASDRWGPLTAASS